MAKRITAKVEEYQKDGETKGKYVEIGVILENNNGQFILLDPTVNLAGVLAKQNVMEFSKGGQMRDNVMCSIFDNDNQQNQPNQNQGGFQNNNQGGFNQNQGGFNNQSGFQNNQ